MKQHLGYLSFRDGLSHFLTPQLFKQAHQACPPKQDPSRWALHPLLWVLLTMSWGCGDSQEEKFVTARAAYVACHQSTRRPGLTLAGFLLAVARLPLCVLRRFSQGVRQQLDAELVESLRINGWVPVACDGTRLECPRSAELQQRLGEAGKDASAPMVYLTTFVLLPVGVLWSWRLGKGTANEIEHLRRLLVTLPRQALLVADAFHVSYDLFVSILQAEASFLIRMSSRAYLYTLKQVPLDRFREGIVYYWPEAVQAAGQPPRKVRLLRVCGKNKTDVWLLTNVLQRRVLSHRTAAQVYRWRWRNEGLFCVYKRMMNKLKLESRTVALVHREAEVSLLALQLLLAMTVQETRRGREIVIVMDSPRRMLLRIRGQMTGLLRSLGPRQFAAYQERLTVVRTGERLQRRSTKVRQEWPRRKAHKPPKPPKIRVMSEPLKAKMAKVLLRVAA